MPAFLCDPLVIALIEFDPAGYLVDPLILSLDGVDPTTLVVTLSHPTAGAMVAYSAPLGGWQAGFTGTVSPDGSGGLDVAITTHPALAEGWWTVTVACSSFGGIPGGGFWLFRVGQLVVSRLWQSSLNTVDIEWDEAPKYLDPADPTDTLFRAAFTTTGPASPARLLQAVTLLEDGITTRLWYDGDLVVGESYTISITGLESDEDDPLFPDPTTGTFIAYGPDRHPLPLQQQTSGRYDIRNPQATRDAPTGEPLATFVMDKDGDLGIETGRPYLRKRIFRRLATRKGEMFHEPTYGLSLKDKGLYRPRELRALQMDVEAQVRSEPNVKACRAGVSELAPGIVYAVLKVQDDLGWFDLETELRGPV